MDINISNVCSYLNYLNDNEMSFNNKTLGELVNKIQKHQYTDQSLYQNLVNDIMNNNKENIINHLIPNLMKEFKLIDTCIVTKLLDYMETKSELTSFVVNHNIINKNNNTSNLNKIGEYIEKMLDDFIANDINNNFLNQNKSKLIQTYKPRALKKGGLVLRNLFMDIEKYLVYFNQQDEYKFSRKLLKQRDKLIENLSDYDVTLVFGDNNNQQYKNFLNDTNTFENTIMDTLESVKETIVKDIYKGNNSKIRKILNFIMENIPNNDLLLKNVISKETFNKLPDKLDKTIVYGYNKNNKTLIELYIGYNDKNALYFSFDVKNKIKMFFRQKISNNENTLDLPLKFTHSSISDKNERFELLRILGIFNLNENNNSVIIQNSPDPNVPNKIYKNAYSFNCELLDVSVDLIASRIVRECDFEKNNNTITLGFNSILYDNVKMFVAVPNKPEKRCKRLSIIFSIYNVIYTLIKLKKYNYELITDWYDKYTDKEKIDFFEHIIQICFGRFLNFDYNFVSKLKLHHLALIYDRISFDYAQDTDSSVLSKNIRKFLSKFLYEWRLSYSKLFSEFLKKYNDEYYDKLYFIGGSQFDIDKKLIKFNDYENELDKINGIKNIKTYSVDLDCLIYLKNKNENDLNSKVESFYKNFRNFVNQNVNSEFINSLTKLAIKEEGDNGVWIVTRNVKKTIFYKLNYLRGHKYTDYYPLEETAKEIHPMFTSIDNGYMEYYSNGDINYDKSRPYLLLRQSIVLKNSSCNFIKNPHLFELNIIAQSRLFDMYEFFKNYNFFNKLDIQHLHYNMIFVFLQYICFNIKEKDTMKYMLYSTWLNYIMKIKPQNNLYRFVHYAKYFHLKNLYDKYMNDFNKKLVDFFNIKNVDYVKYYNIKLPNDIIELNKLIDICNNYDENLLINETEYTPFNCPTEYKSTGKHIMDVEYEEFEDFDIEQKQQKEEEKSTEYMDMYSLSQEDTIQTLKRMKLD
jgi:hypothetical protein